MGAIAKIVVWTGFAFIAILTLSIILAARLARLFGSTDLAAWIQAVGAILAIVAGFGAIYCQRASERLDEQRVRMLNARTAHLIACQALAVVGERLDAILAASQNKYPFMLRGDRTTEMITSLREFDTGRVPAELLETFLQVRSSLFALNRRISDVYRDEDKTKSGPARRAERRRRLVGAMQVWSGARTHLIELTKFLEDSGETGLCEAPDKFDFEKKELSLLESNVSNTRKEASSFAKLVAWMRLAFSRILP